uniref:Uncharacterized protein n=1 Tax=Vitis vinifera TaxID=29760 RepID=F6HLK3_VITVI
MAFSYEEVEILNLGFLIVWDLRNRETSTNATISFAWEIFFSCLSFSLTDSPIMGRGRGKGKKQTVIATRDDPGSGEDEKIPAYKRRGRPQKPVKDDVEEEEEAEKVAIEEDGENEKGPITSKDAKNQATTENGRKRKRSLQTKENSDSVKEENGTETKSNNNDLKSVGFRQNGSRRKNKPRRAAEAGVECK